VRQAVAQWLEVVDLADTTREWSDDLIRLLCFARLRRPAGGQTRRPGPGPPLRPAPAMPGPVRRPPRGRARVPSWSALSTAGSSVAGSYLHGGSQGLRTV
jgi:hypothetical protein